jgi:hypothetical protein
MECAVVVINQCVARALTVTTIQTDYTRHQEFQAAASEAAAELVSLDLFEESEARCGALEARVEGLEAERDALLDKVCVGPCWWERPSDTTAQTH